MLRQVPHKLHRYAGVFFAPTLLFFCVSGLLQTLDLHKARAGVQPPRLVLELAALHKNQTLETPHRSPGGARADRPAPARRESSLGTRLMKLFVAGAAVTLGATTLAGLYISLQVQRGRSTVWALFALGVATPLGLMLLM